MRKARLVELLTIMEFERRQLHVQIQTERNVCNARTRLMNTYARMLQEQQKLSKAHEAKMAEMLTWPDE